MKFDIQHCEKVVSSYNAFDVHSGVPDMKFCLHTGYIYSSSFNVLYSLQTIWWYYFKVGIPRFLIYHFQFILPYHAAIQWSMIVITPIVVT